MGSSKNANFVTGAFGGEHFKSQELYRDANSGKPDRSIAQPSPEVKKVEPKTDSATASEKAEAIKDSEVPIKDADKNPIVSKSRKKRDKIQKAGKNKDIEPDEVPDEEEIEDESQEN